MPAESFGIPHIIVLVIVVGLIFLLARINMRTKSRPVKYGTGAVVAAMGGIVISYFVALIITPLISRGQADYLFKFWGTFIGLAMISLITGGLLGLLYTQNKESQESGEIDESE
ncbi:MAG: hypothetical protein K8T10_09665 [Candidatus Eremiobacteraeota bacterium]|nr:hypothetical protein [Candidatus Eremiobacteraeota bacterium]